MELSGKKIRDVPLKGIWDPKSAILFSLSLSLSLSLILSLSVSSLSLYATTR
jgi:hypothetical protein